MPELKYGVEREMALTMTDLLMRRTRVAFESRDHGVAAAARVAEWVAMFAGWSNYQTRSQLDAYSDEIARVFAVDP